MAEQLSENWAGLLDVGWYPDVQLAIETWGIAGGLLHHKNCEELPGEDAHSAPFFVTFSEAAGAACRRCLQVAASSPKGEVELAAMVGQIAGRVAVGMRLLEGGKTEEAQDVGSEIKDALQYGALATRLNKTFSVRTVAKIAAAVQLEKHCEEVAALQEEEKVVILPSESTLWEFSCRVELERWRNLYYWDEFENLTTGERIFEKDLPDLRKAVILTPAQAGVALVRGAFGMRGSLADLLEEGKIAVADKNIDPERVRLAGDILRAGSHESPWSMEDALEAAELATGKREVKPKTRGF